MINKECINNNLCSIQPVYVLQCSFIWEAIQIFENSSWAASLISRFIGLPGKHMRREKKVHTFLSKPASFWTVLCLDLFLSFLFFLHTELFLLFVFQVQACHLFPTIRFWLNNNFFKKRKKSIGSLSLDAQEWQVYITMFMMIEWGSFSEKRNATQISGEKGQKASANLSSHTKPLWGVL